MIMGSTRNTENNMRLSRVCLIIAVIAVAIADLLALLLGPSDPLADNALELIFAPSRMVILILLLAGLSIAVICLRSLRGMLILAIVFAAHVIFFRAMVSYSDRASYFFVPRFVFFPFSWWLCIFIGITAVLAGVTGVKRYFKPTNDKVKKKLAASKIGNSENAEQQQKKG